MNTASVLNLRAEHDSPEYHPEFWDWLSENYDIYEGFVKLARRAKIRGYSHWSARASIHVLRWESAKVDTDQNFKINNNASSGMARLAMAMHKDLEGLFHTRGRSQAQFPLLAIAA